MIKIYKSIIFGGASTVILLAIVFLLRFNQVWRYNKWLSFYIISHIITEIIYTSLAIFKIRNLETGLLFCLIEGILLLMTYNFAFKMKGARLFSMRIIPVYVIGFILIYFLIDAHLYIPSYTYAYHKTFMLLVVVLYFIERILLMDDLYIEQNPMFYISCGFILFYSISILYIGMSDYLFHNFPNINFMGAALHSITLSIMYVLLCKGIWTIQKA